MSKIIIIGAGPAGLTAGYELLMKDPECEVVILEETNSFGGISKTINYKGNRMDMGGHRFFSKIPEVNKWWDTVLPLQGAPSLDDKILGRSIPLQKGGPDPDKVERVMLRRNRVSRIFFNNKFYDYPLSLKLETFKNMGLADTIKVGCSYFITFIRKLPENSLENFYINRFGRKLYTLFFEYYTENLWGRHPKEIDASWGTQRVKGLSVWTVIKDACSKAFGIKGRKVETSLIEEFKYPKLGPGQMWEVTAEKIIQMGGIIITDAKVIKIHKKVDNIVTGVTYVKNSIAAKNVEEISLEGDVIISSMPLKDLVLGMSGVPNVCLKIARGLPYRDYMTLGVLVSGLKLKNKTKMKTISDIVPDCWVYVQDRRVKLGRFQIYNNWSPYMIKDIEHTVWIGLEYFVNENDEYWNMNEDEFSALGISEMIKVGLIDSSDEVLDTHMEKVKKAYPAYFDTYEEIDTLIDYLKKIDNLYCVGRNGQHRYNNIDHSMCTSFEAVKNILSGEKCKDNIWNVNTEKEYHES